MRRNVLVALVAAGALWLGVMSILRGQVLLGVGFIGLAVLRSFMLFQAVRPRKPQPSIRLNIDGDEIGSDGSDGHGS